ncbi:Piso0_001490 [Millerozyma farinosa CBS 7064]|uniref:proline--tRNA ligase n=1 Tax=Pichia sorbitophila (strain ATCC MYA-4447 / BCRC 22081 / CBS 7064 / NBRC 10061 / NRRL Y-12695) TaxID=559304 RepID=G8YKX8_PICSO|nr:Piso0_001490 [Millerozyma farinosa CBS 7064]
MWTKAKHSLLAVRCVRNISSKNTNRIPSTYVTNTELRPSNLQTFPTHELFTKIGFISHPRSGLVNWLPLGLRISRKITAIINNRMEQIGAEELSLSQLSKSDLWQITGRWDNSELFKLKDSSDSEYCLVPTCEEEITQLVKEQLKSYKSLPLIYYQIKEKFRDEKRPRSGLLRGREFIMKDAYSFDLSETDAMSTYEKMIGAYKNIFTDLRLPYKQAEADTGDIGGTLSHEWHYVHESGEDTLFECSSCGNVSNVEKTLSFPQEPDEKAEVSVSYFKTTDNSTLVCAYYPSNRTLEPSFMKEDIPDIDLGDRNEAAILEEFSDEETLISKRVVRIMDARLTSRSNFPDFPIPFVNRSLITTLTDVPIVVAQEGEICSKCEDGELRTSKAIEVGHTFYLGDKYSEPLKLLVDSPDSSGKMKSTNVMMGCYGIGISRIVAAIGELTRDENGFRWPVAIAPWQVTILEAQSSIQNVEKLYDQLNGNNIEYKLDDRPKVGIGKKIFHSNLVGIPLVVVIGKNFPMVEIEVRGLRYKDNVDLQWRKDFQTKSFEWTVEEDTYGHDKKHFVHVDGAAQVIKSLLLDM